MLEDWAIPLRETRISRVGTPVTNDSNHLIFLDLSENSHVISVQRLRTDKDASLNSTLCNCPDDLVTAFKEVRVRGLRNVDKL